MTVREMLEKRAKLISDARAIYTLAETEHRDATAEERTKFDVIMADSDTLKDDADRIGKLEVAESGLEESQGRQSRLADPEGQTTATTKRFELRNGLKGQKRYINIPIGPEADQRMEEFRAYLLTGEKRALSKTVDVEGGFLSAPVEFMAEIIQELDNLVFMRQISRVLPPLLESGTLGAPEVDTKMTDPAWTSELDIGAEDTALNFKRRDLTPNVLAKFIKVSETLLRRSTINVDEFVRERLAIAFGEAEEKAFLTGPGTTEPLGVFTVDAAGISSGRDVDEDNTTTAFTADGLINAQMFVQAQYRRNGSWIFHRDGVKLIRKLKDNDGHFIFQPALMPNVPDSLLGDPLRESEFAPNTFTTGLLVGIYGDFANYWIVDALTMTIRVLVELFAATNQVGYLGRLEADAQPVQEKAFARVKLA